ncbi:hypothetical protein DOZ80_28965 [Pseudomonas fluorescens]|uniref:Pesticidal crystal protein domain-containing protein n=1 Tax=Pseudomonas fluorescens TaxID=294 RepID=A0A327MLM6_PSEFL|nr:insecticidal delta-endotoxin Cry8Ea1 family protein [Pseudomonas fluorescens]RAI63133.1 hypothetical protein DOZ80_28965 [Pseudomonas fluorescens]
MSIELSAVDIARTSLMQRTPPQGDAMVRETLQPNTEIIEPSTGVLKSTSGMSGDLYSILRHSILSGLKLVPVAGGFFSYLGALFIPNNEESPEKMWSRLIDSKISEATIKKVQRDLVGLSNVAKLYKNAIENGNNETIREQSIAASTQFTAMVPGFQLSGEESALLPLFAIAATLHLALLRDMALRGKEIGISDAHVATYAKELNILIKQYSDYVDTYVAAAIDKTRRDNPNGSTPQRRNMPLSAMLETKTHYQITVIDFRDTWSGFDPIRFPGKSSIKLNREVFTPILGWWDSNSSAPDVIPDWEPPQTPLQKLKVWDKDQWRTRFIYGFESTYADGSSLISGSKTDIVYEIPVGSYIDEVMTQSTAGVFHISFRSDGAWKTAGRAPSDEIIVREFRSAFPGHRLSSIRSVGTGRMAAEGAVSGCVLGFQLIDQEAPSISIEVFDAIAPKIAPQLLQWMVS